jgi:hypothetical protein
MLAQANRRAIAREIAARAEKPDSTARNGRRVRLKKRQRSRR